jgi:glutaredoxin
VLDKDGVIRYIDIHAIDDQPDNEVLRNVLRGLQSVPVVQQVYPSISQEEDELPEGGAVLYCARWCKDCRKARAWLESHGVAYQEVDIDYNLKARARVRQWANGALVTPTIDLFGTVVLDYKEDKLEEALRAAQQEGRA